MTLSIPIRSTCLRRDNPWRAVWLLIALLFGDLAVSHHTLVGSQAWAQTPKRSIGLNSDYPFPDAQTPAGMEVTSTALVENANAWNGRIISFKGEAIGERMVRGSMAWIHLNDDAYMEKSIEAGAGSEGYNSGQAIWLSIRFGPPDSIFRRLPKSGRHCENHRHFLCGLRGARGRHGYPRHGTDRGCVRTSRCSSDQNEEGRLGRYSDAVFRTSVLESEAPAEPTPLSSGRSVSGSDGRPESRTIRPSAH